MNALPCPIRSIPTVLHGCDDLRLGVPNVECDEYLMRQMAVDHLLHQEHRHFACFRYSDNVHALRRRDGFQNAVREAGYDCMDLEMISEHGNGSGEWFRKQLPKLPKPLGLFAEDDLLTARVIETAAEAGWKVPADLAVVGCGNIPLRTTPMACLLKMRLRRAKDMLTAGGAKTRGRRRGLRVWQPAHIPARVPTARGSAATSLETGAALRRAALQF